MAYYASLDMIKLKIYPFKKHLIYFVTKMVFGDQIVILKFISYYESILMVS